MQPPDSLLWLDWQERKGQPAWHTQWDENKGRDDCRPQSGLSVTGWLRWKDKLENKHKQIFGITIRSHFTYYRLEWLTNMWKNSFLEGWRQRKMNSFSMKRYTAAERDGNNKYAVVCSTSLSGPPCSAWPCLSQSLRAQALHAGPLYPLDPLVFFLSRFSHSPSPWGRDTTHFAQYCQIKSRCPFLI